MTVPPLLAHFGPLLYPAALIITSAAVQASVKVFFSGGRALVPGAPEAPTTLGEVFPLPPLSALKPEAADFTSDRLDPKQSSC